jgi:hypothetical protein
MDKLKPQLDMALLAQAEIVPTGEIPQIGRAARAYQRIWEATPSLASSRQIAELQAAENQLREALLPTRVVRHEMTSPNQ